MQNAREGAAARVCFLGAGRRGAKNLLLVVEPLFEGSESPRRPAWALSWSGRARAASSFCSMPMSNVLEVYKNGLKLLILLERSRLKDVKDREIPMVWL